MTDDEIVSLKQSLEDILNSLKSVQAECNNAHRDGRDGFMQCGCWRCNPVKWGKERP